MGTSQYRGSQFRAPGWLNTNTYKMMNRKIASLNLNDDRLTRFNIDSGEVDPELAGQLGAEFENGTLDQPLPGKLCAFRPETVNASMTNPEITFWRGPDKISHFAICLDVEGSLIAQRLMNRLYHDLQEEDPDFLDLPYSGRILPAPGVYFLIYPGYEYLSKEDQQWQKGIIHTITLGIYTMSII